VERRTGAGQTKAHTGNTLSERVYEELESGILSRRYKQGAALNELKISAELGVSRTPVREALRMLEQKGLVETLPYRGAVVVGINRKDLEDIYTIRMLVEGLAARWAAGILTDAELQTLAEIVDLQEFYHQKNATIRINDLDSRFHEQIFAYSGSRTLKHVLSELHHIILWFRELSFGSAGRAEKAIEEHRQILGALQKRDGDLAESLTVEHIKNARENLLKILDTEGNMRKDEQ